jgi:hypothetical protein
LNFFFFFFFFESLLGNANLEIERLTRLLETEIERSSMQKSKLEEEIRSLKQQTKFHNMPCILSPPSRRGSSVASVPQPSAVRKHGHYVVGLTGDWTDNVVEIFSRLGATIVDVDSMSLGLCSAGGSVSVTNG